MRVDINAIREMKMILSAINRADLAELELFEDGSKIEVLPESIRDWSFYGLDNVDFVVDRGWEARFIEAGQD
jgi:hypothetical protein